MILDNQALFSDKQAVTATAASTNIIDLGATGTPPNGNQLTRGDMGKGTKVPLLAQVTTEFAGLTSLTIAVQTATDEAFTSPTTLVSQTINLAQLTAGARFALPVLPYGALNRYLRLYYTVAGTGTAGAITAGITLGNDETRPF